MPTTPYLDKPTLEEYPEWLRDQHDIDLLGGTQERRFDILLPSLKDQFQRSPFWAALRNEVSRWNDDFKAEHNDYNLVESVELPEVETKLWKSVVEKSFRWNVVNNTRWPASPIEASSAVVETSSLAAEGDWYGPKNWLQYFTDIVRARLTTTYMDGAIVLASRLEDLGHGLGVKTQNRPIAREDGYHAIHILVSQSFETIEPAGDPSSTQGWVEVQITTHIQETIGRMLHGVYEEWRLREEPPPGWQWDHESKEFAVNYLGPTLHYIEGMIVVARERMD